MASKLMSKFIIVFALASFSLFTFIPNQTSAQPTRACDTKPPLEKTAADQLLGVSQDVTVECLSDKLAVVVFDETKRNLGWTAIDAFMDSNYTIADVVPSGMGSVANPTRLYVIMTTD